MRFFTFVKPFNTIIYVYINSAIYVNVESGGDSTHGYKNQQRNIECSCRNVVVFIHTQLVRALIMRTVQVLNDTRLSISLLCYYSSYFVDEFLNLFWYDKNNVNFGQGFSPTHACLHKDKKINDISINIYFIFRI